MESAIAFADADSIRAEKAAMRRAILSLRANLSPAEFARASAVVCEKILALAEFRRAKTVMAFSPIRDEINIRPILSAILQSGKTLALPVVDKKNRLLIPRVVADLQSDLAPSYMGILEPSAACPAAEKIDLIIAPAAACDDDGYRLGYGGGFYDRFLALADPDSVAPIFRCQRVREVPRESHDFPVRKIISN